MSFAYSSFPLVNTNTLNFPWKFPTAIEACLPIFPTAKCLSSNYSSENALLHSVFNLNRDIYL